MPVSREARDADKETETCGRPGKELRGSSSSSGSSEEEEEEEEEEKEGMIEQRREQNRKETRECSSKPPPPPPPPKRMLGYVLEVLEKEDEDEFLNEREGGLKYYTNRFEFSS